jgi:hypothetical protein
MLGDGELLEAVAGVVGLDSDSGEGNLLEVCDHIVVDAVVVGRNHTSGDAAQVNKKREIYCKNSREKLYTSERIKVE